MDENGTDPSQNAVHDDKKPLLDSVPRSGSYIVKFKTDVTGDNASQIFQNFVTPSIETHTKDNEGETDIAFEIIQEPLLNDSVVIENNRLFFETDYSLDKTGHQQKEHQTIVLSERSKDESVVIRTEEKLENPLSNCPLKDVLVDDTQYDFPSSNAVTSSSLQSQTSPVANKSIKLEIPDPEDAENKKHRSPEIIKKTMVEAFVKMIVCRKITVQKRDAQSGEILDVDVKTEEDEPVVLGVDYVETTEDVISGHGSKHTSDTFKGTSTDSSFLNLKVLKGLPENSSKISKSLLSSSVLQSTLQRGISKVLQADKNAIQKSSTVTGSGLTSEKGVHKKEDSPSKVNSESDDEWVEEMNYDDSADYNPHLRSKSKSSEEKSRKGLKNMKSAKSREENSNLDSNRFFGTEKAYTDISIPKKRGRKRKWDRTIGLASNLKTCQFCNKKFDSVTSCSKHMKKGDCVSSHFCFICSNTFESEQQLETHISSHRNENKSTSFHCTDCRRSYRTKAGYVKHFRMGTCKKRDNFEDGETGDYSCEICDARFSSPDYLQLHQYKAHENPKDRHVCPNCGRTFYSLQGFQRHRSGRPCTEPLKCYICGKTYKSKESFKLHMKHHKSEITGVTYNCDECGRSYMTEAALTKHKLLHTGIKPYKCDICEKEFAMRYQVKDHARMHSGEKPYSCTLCGVAFGNKGHLGRHIRSHENGTLFRRGRPKKLQDSVGSSSGETEIKLIDLGQTLQTMDGQTIQVVDGQIFNTQGDGQPMIIQADNNTIIIADWQDNSASVSQAVVSSENIGSTS